jgi:hypothetical protein
MTNVIIVNAVYPPEPVVLAQMGRDLKQELVKRWTKVACCVLNLSHLRPPITSIRGALEYNLTQPKIFYETRPYNTTRIIT